MLSAIPNPIIQTLTSAMKGEITDFVFSSGGCINPGGRLVTSSGNYFLKWNDAQRFPGMFEAEKKGLFLLSAADVIKIPSVSLMGEAGGFQFILLEFIDAKRKSSTYWQALGTQLARLHRNSAASYGLDHDNYIGSLRQKNKTHADWLEFFIEERLSRQLQVARDNDRITKEVVVHFENLFKKLPQLLTSEAPALLHGDLWSGNLITGESGEPVLIDPAVYYGHRECEIAFTGLFGGFSPEFYQSYDESFPLQQGYRQRFEIYNLYPLMVHVNLFGGGYLGQVVSILRQFV
jgi:fructosamine-3-kinase